MPLSMPSVPGVVVRAELDRPRSWRGRWRGQDVDVVVLPVVPEPAIRQAALAAMQPLVGVAPGCHEVLLCHDGIAVVSAAVHGRSLADLPPLDPGRAVTLGVAVAQAVSCLHARGLVWGTSYDEVVVDDRGALGLPLHAMAERRLAGARCTPGDDVEALIAMLRARCPELVVEATDMRMLARRLRRAARPRPLVVTGSRDASSVRAPRRDEHGHERGQHPAARGRLVVAGLGVIAVVGVGAAGWFSGRPSSPRPDIAPARSAAPAVPAVSAATGALDWRATVDALDRARAAGLASARPLTDADAAGSPALAADTATAARLYDIAPRTVPPVAVITAVTVLRAGATSTVLKVSDTLPAYAYRDAAGRTIGTAPARPARTWTVTLTHAAGGWRFSEVS